MIKDKNKIFFCYFLNDAGLLLRRESFQVLNPFCDVAIVEYTVI
jgi:hypothetical protein